MEKELQQKSAEWRSLKLGGVFLRLNGSDF
jgi:hypothetical protein